MPFDINSARTSGYSDDEIKNFLSSAHSNFDVNKALSSGYSLDEIAKEVEGNNAQSSGLDRMKQMAKMAIGTTAGYEKSQQYSPSDFFNKGMAGLSALYNKGGEMTAEGLAAKGANPYVSAGVGTAVSMAPDIAMMALGPESAATSQRPPIPNYPPIQSGQKILPRLLNKIGIPEKATQIAMQNPAMTLPVPEVATAIEAGGQRIPEMMKDLKSNVGQLHGKVMAEKAGLPNPLEVSARPPFGNKLIPRQEQVQTGTSLVQEQYPGTGRTIFKPGEPIMETKRTLTPGPAFEINPPNHPLLKLKGDANRVQLAIENGEDKFLRDVQKDYLEPGHTKYPEGPMTDPEKLNLLTKIKRGLESKKKYGSAAVSLTPIESKENAAIDMLTSELQQTRSAIPGGDVMASADAQWHKVNEIYDNIQRSFATTGKAKDTLNRIFRSVEGGATEGSMQDKGRAIREVEKLTGKNLLDPIQNLQTSQAFSKQMGKGISHTLGLGGGFLSAAGDLVTGNFSRAAGKAGTALVASSPAAAGSAIRGISNLKRAGMVLGRGVQDVGSNMLNPRTALGAKALLDALTKQRKK